jgi:hypothetical protein
MATKATKRTIAPATPPTSPFNSVKRVRLTYTSTNEALQELNAAKEEASLAHMTNSGTTPELIEATPKGRGRYKVQWGSKMKSFMMIGTVSAHDMMIKKEVNIRSYMDQANDSRQIPSSISSLRKTQST